MPCYYPMTGYRSRTINPATGKRSIVFSPSKGYIDMPVTIPCGQCIGCRLERSRQWAIRCVHESSLHERNCFITLTYNNENLPDDGSLKLEHWQKFMKRFRKKHGEGIRFFHCGEYGEQFGRPHYHAIIFGFDFDDRVYYKNTASGSRIDISADLATLWPFGFSSVGNVTFESAAYVARYIMKKVTGDEADSHYNGKKPEYVTMSRRPGIARDWYKQFKGDVFPSDEVVLRGKKFRPPKFYSGLFEVENPDEFKEIKKKRLDAAKKHSDNNSVSRLRVREKVKKAQIKSLRKKL